jgi:hypothetical protein
MMIGTAILLIRNNLNKIHVFLSTIFCYHHTHLNIPCFEITFFQKNVR